MLIMDVSYKTLHKHLKRAVWVIHIWALRWISKGWSGSHTSVWWPPKACISAQGGSAFLSSPSATPQCTDVSSGTVSWSKELTQGWNNQQIRESGGKKTTEEEYGERRGKAAGWVLLPVAGIYCVWQYLLDYSITCNSRHFKGSQV